MQASCIIREMSTLRPDLCITFRASPAAATTGDPRKSGTGRDVRVVIGTRPARPSRSPEPHGGAMVARVDDHDPFWDDGKGARRRNRRVRLEGVVALMLAIAACGLTAAMWARQVLPVLGVQI